MGEGKIKDPSESSRTINCRNNCRHEESFKLTFRDIVWRGYTRLERVSPDTRDIIYGDSIRSDVYYVPCKCTVLDVHRVTPYVNVREEFVS